jgi:transcriptional regulator GlxA family with amidase domain
MDGRSFVVVGYPGAELLDIACIPTALDVANRAGAAYEVRTVAPGGRANSCQSGLMLERQGALERVREGPGQLAAPDPAVPRRARADAARCVRQARTEAAAALLVATTPALDRIAARRGFRSAEAPRQAFRGRYGITPARYRAVYTSMASTSVPPPSGTSNQTQNSASERGTTTSRR